MINLDNVERKASRGISNCIFNVYGGVGYFTGIEDNVYTVDIYDSPSRVIIAMSDEDAKKHLLKSISVDFEISEDSVAEYRIIDKIVSTVEKTLYNS